MTYLLLLRHGESVFNQKNIFTGWLDPSLTHKGIMEALDKGEKYKDTLFDVAFTSNLIRAQLTTFLFLSCQKGEKAPMAIRENALFTLQKEDLPVFFRAALNERNYGLLQGLNKEEVEKELGIEKFKEIRRSFHGIPPEGESLMMTKERVIPCFQAEVLPLLEAGKNVLIAAHGNSLRAIVMEIEKLNEEEIIRFELQTGEAILYHFSNSQFKKVNN